MDFNMPVLQAATAQVSLKHWDIWEIVVIFLEAQFVVTGNLIVILGNLVKMVLHAFAIEVAMKQLVVESFNSRLNFKAPRLRGLLL